MVASTSKIPTSTSASGFDAHFGHPFALRASTLALVLESPTSTSGFYSNSGGISDFDLQGLRLLWSSPSGIDACFGLPFALQHRLVGAAPAQRAGAVTGRGRAPEAGADGHPPAAALPGQLCSQ